MANATQAQPAAATQATLIDPVIAETEGAIPAIIKAAETALDKVSPGAGALATALGPLIEEALSTIAQPYVDRLVAIEKRIGL